MPNVKIYVHEAVYAARRAELTAALAPLRQTIIRHLNVPKSACQLAMLPCIGLADEPALNVEMHILPDAQRTRESLEAMGAVIRDTLHAVTGSAVAFRCVQLDPETYIAMKEPPALPTSSPG